jgi:hypothetical protein
VARRRSHLAIRGDPFTFGVEDGQSEHVAGPLPANSTTAACNALTSAFMGGMSGYDRTRRIDFRLSRLATSRPARGANREL